MRFELSGNPSNSRAAWSTLSDTDWMNRVAGNGAIRDMQWADTDSHGERELQGIMAGLFGTPMPFVEDQNHWVHEQYFVQHRTFSSGPLLKTQYEVRLEPTLQGAIPHLSLELVPRSALFIPVLSIVLRKVRSAWADVIHSLPSAHDESSTGAILRTLPGGIRHAAQQLRKHAPEEHVEQILRHLQTARPVSLQSIRSNALAERWGQDPEELLSTMLHATMCGLVELFWSVRCTRCHGQVARVAHLSDISAHSECDSCQISRETDLGENVEVLFAAHPSLTPRSTESFCSLFPAGAPQIALSTFLEPGEHKEERFSLAPGRWRLGVHGRPDTVFNAVGSGQPGVIQWPSPEALTTTVGADSLRLQIRNPGESSTRFMLVADPDQGSFVTAAHLNTLPLFRRSMGQQLLSPNTRISTRSVTLLFTDLTDSTQLYEQLGDADAYAFVRDHFQVLTQVIEAEGGVVVKTIGDAIMAAFHEPYKATLAAIRACQAMDQWAEAQGLDSRPRLKLGVNAGPALVVYSKRYGHDYFGASVNLAARAQGEAMGGEIVLTQSMYEQPQVAELLRSENLEAQPMDGSLKGIEGITRLYRITVV